MEVLISVVVMMEFVSIRFIKWVFFASFICSSLAIETLNQSCDTNDLLALKQFAGNLTNGSIISAWSKEKDGSYCCNWEGVVCDNLLNRVIRLILPRKGLKGKISDSLGGLEELQWLNLSDNSLEGGIPLALSNLQQLEVLDFSSNMFSGTVSEVLGGLGSLRVVNLSSNSFTGELVELHDFPNLVAINVSNNLLKGRIDTKICNSSNVLRVLDLSMNQFSGGFMEDGVVNCSRTLRQLHVDGNSLSGQLPDTLFHMSSLEHLSLACNSFSGELSEKISKLFRLKSLVIPDNQFSGSLPNVFGNLTELENLIVHTNFFSGSLPSSLSLCPRLQVLDLRNNSLNGVVDFNFTKLPHLTTLDLATNRFTGPLPATLSNCRKLITLSLARNSFDGEIPLGFANLISLSFVSVSNNSFVNLPHALGVLQQCPNLTTLILTRNFYHEEIPQNVSGFEHLMVLALGNCGLSGEIPIWLLNCTRLQVIDLSWNHLGGSIPSWIGQMERLFYLDFSNNSFTGELPKSITDLRNLISPNACTNATTSLGIPLYVKRNRSAHGLQYNQASSFPPSLLLSNNKITGTLWPEIGRLKGLHVLDLSRNNITGTIPSTISDMGNLEVLDLSFNDLNGSIPWSFNKLTFLSRFNVANNSLQGEIPSGGQFSSFPNSSFEGNWGLCGAQFIPCRASNVTQPGVQAAPSSKISRGTIVGITISIGVGIALLLAVVLLSISRKDATNPIDDVEENFCRSNRPSEGLGLSKLVVLFQNSDCKELTIGDILKSTNGFDQSNIIGCGGFGLVYKANLPNGTKAAIKRLSGDCGQMEREFRAEVEALSRAQHKNLVPLQGYCKHGSDRLLIYSYMENGSLDYWLHERVDGGTVLKWDVRLKIARGAGKGLAYLHKGCDPNIVHRDVKSSNILLDGNFEAHLADFGLSRLLCPYDTHVTTDLVGTLGYIPPEYSQTLTATFKGDVYSFGVVLLELLTSRRPVDVCKGKGCRDLVSWVLQLKAENKEEQIIDPAIWSKDLKKQFVEVLGVACKCIDQDPRRRPSIEQVVLWLDSVRVDDA